MSHENLVVQLAEQIFFLSVQKIQAGISKQLAFPRNKIYTNTKTQNDVRNKLTVLYIFSIMFTRRIYKCAVKSRKSTKLRGSWSDSAFSAESCVWQCHASRLSRNDLRDDCDRIIARLIIDLKQRCSFSSWGYCILRRIDFIKTRAVRNQQRWSMNLYRVCIDNPGIAVPRMNEI